MPIFKYTGRDAQGLPVEGEIEAATKEAAADAVMQKSILPTDIREQSAHEKSLDLSAIFSSKVITTAQPLFWPLLF